MVMAVAAAGDRDRAAKVAERAERNAGTVTDVPAGRPAPFTVGCEVSRLDGRRYGEYATRGRVSSARVYRPADGPPDL